MGKTKHQPPNQMAEHLSVEVLEDAIGRLSKKLVDIREIISVDQGQKKAPTKKDYVNACIRAQQIINT